MLANAEGAHQRGLEEQQRWQIPCARLGGLEHRHQGTSTRAASQECEFINNQSLNEIDLSKM